MNFAAWLISQMVSKRELKVADDQISSPTLADDLAGAILSIVKTNSGGIFHAAGATSLSRYEFAVRVATKLGHDPELIHPVRSDELNQLARRPMNSSLISSRLESETGYRMMPIEAALELFASQAKSGVTAR
jgi:dTDP-4-dehydrorhamnose reductase